MIFTDTIFKELNACWTIFVGILVPKFTQIQQKR